MGFTVYPRLLGNTVFWGNVFGEQYQTFGATNPALPLNTWQILYPVPNDKAAHVLGSYPVIASGPIPAAGGSNASNGWQAGKDAAQGPFITIPLAATLAPQNGPYVYVFRYQNSGFVLSVDFYADSPSGGGVPGCTDPTAQNFNSAATVDDGSCLYTPGGGGGSSGGGDGSGNGCANVITWAS